MMSHPFPAAVGIAAPNRAGPMTGPREDIPPEISFLVNIFIMRVMTNVSLDIPFRSDDSMEMPLDDRLDPPPVNFTSPGSSILRANRMDASRKNCISPIKKMLALSVKIRMLTVIRLIAKDRCRLRTILLSF